MSNDFLGRIRDYISTNGLLKKDGKYIAALSGGADSVALLRILLTLGYKVEVAHCNFQLRGMESDMDERFSKELCGKLNIPIHVIHFDTKTYANLHKVSIELAARELRYRYFESLRKDINANATCVAHQQDDNAETVLINLTRGTGLKGLTGIAPRNTHVVRPLLCVGRKEILGYLESLGQEYVTDSSNLIDDITRNKVRIDVIPLLESINPSAKANINRAARRLSEVSKIVADSMLKAVEHVSTKTKTGISISLIKLKEVVSIEYTLFYILSDYGFSPTQIEQIAGHIDANPGKEWNSKTHIAIIDRGQLLVEGIEIEKPRRLIIPECGSYLYSETCKIKIETIKIGTSFEVSMVQDRVCLDAEKVAFPLTLRRVRVGDRFVPFGMNGSKLVSDYMTDRKMTVLDKRKQLVVVDSSGNIVWLVNQRPDNRYRITQGSEHALSIHFFP